MTYETKLRYSPNPPPQSKDPAQIVLWAYRELQRASVALEQGNIIEKLYAAPDKPQDGQIVYADGTQWNPGSGAGIYAYIGGSWTKL